MESTEGPAISLLFQFYWAENSQLIGLLDYKFLKLIGCWAVKYSKFIGCRAENSQS